MEDGSCSPIGGLIALTTTAGGGSWWISVLVILILILINGFFSASEMAIVTLNDKKIRKQAQENDKQAKRLLVFLDHQENFLSMIQVAITLAGFLSAAFGADSFAQPLYALMDPEGKRPWMATLATVLITLLIAFFSLVLGELVPKRIGISRSESYAKHSVGVLSFCDKIFRPITRFLSASSNLIANALGLAQLTGSERVTEEEIRLMTEASRESGDIHGDEADMINNIFELDDKEVSEIMTPRTAMVALSVESSWDEVVAVAANDRYSRIPVYREDMDDIIGVLHIKDLLRVPKEEQEHFDLSKVVRPAYFVPGTKQLSVFFHEMRQKHLSIGIVVDEYGGTDGIVSLEDVLEEIVGDITDEYDEGTPVCQKLNDGSYVLDGLLTPEEAGHFVPELQAMEDDDDYDTIAGFVLSLLGRIPDADEKATVVFENKMRFTVLEMDDKRIAKIRLEILPKEQA